MESSGTCKDANCFAHTSFSQLPLGKPDHQVCSVLYEAVHRIVVEKVEDNFDSFALAVADVSVITRLRMPK